MWFRQDLRLHDNQAFHAAVRAAKRRGGDVLCVYVWSEEEEGDDAASWRPGGARARGSDTRSTRLTATCGAGTAEASRA